MNMNEKYTTRKKELDEKWANQKRFMKRLAHDFPELFENLNNEYSNLRYGVECDSGWFKLIYNLSGKIYEHMKKTRIKTRVEQIKEKFGGLRYYVSNGDKVIYNMISKAEKLSYQTCEICGKKGKLNQNGWYKTVCEEHWNWKRSID